MMNNIWSDNKYMNLAINILLFLVGINFLHYGQLILPIICFLLFIDNKLHFKVNSPFIFVVLCLFAVSFYAFSYQLGFYSVMGFTCPMAYYIGSNIKHPSEENIRKVIYLFAISMGLHVVLNAIIELILHGVNGFFFSSSHYDFWTRQKISNTGTAINGDYLIGIMYYVLLKEKNKNLKYFTIVLFLLSMFYLVVIGRRTSLIMLAITFIVLFLFESRIIKKMSGKAKAYLIRSFIIAALSVILIIVFYHFNIFSCQKFLNQFRIIVKFRQGLIGDERFKLYFGALKLLTSYPFGGQQISGILGLPIHEFWLDIYDYAGVVPFVLMIIYSLSYVKNIVRLYRDNKISIETKVFLFGIYICTIIQMFLEPIMTGASLFLIISIIVNTIVERCLLDE